MSESRHAPVATTVRRRLAAGSGIDAHHHDGHQIVYASRGVLSVTTSAGAWVAPANRAIWIPAGTVHENRVYGTTVLHTVGLPVSVNPLRLAVPTVLAVSPLLRELLIAYTEPDRGERAERRRLRGVLLDQLRRAPQQPVHLPAGRDERLVAVCALLRDNPGDRRTLAQLGARVGVSHRTLTRLFRAELGMSFPQWRTQLRLHLALTLLADGMPVTAVAHHCGWSTPSAFIDVFRRVMGAPPGRFRA